MLVWLSQKGCGRLDLRSGGSCPLGCKGYDILSTRELLGRIWSSKIIIVCSVKMVKMKR